MFIRRALLIMAVGLSCKNLTIAQELKVDVVAVRTLVTKWNEAHTTNTVGTLSSLYSDTVNFYGSILKRSKCMSIKRAMLEKHKDFHQVMKNELVLSGYSSDAIRCDFVKTVTRNNKAVDYKAYLIVKRFAGNYFIIGESDLTTDRTIKHEPDLGTRVTIRDVKYDDDIADTSTSTLADMIILWGSLAVGLFGLLTGLRRWQRSGLFKRTKRIASADQREVYFEKGLTFEKFIVQQFAIRKDLFTLMEWRSDKFHEGIFPESNRNPDLVYKYRYKDFVRTFSVECKYRSKLFNGSIQLMDENKYKIYEAYHKNEMPVYIVLGFGGNPGNPAKVFLIPFEDVKLEMPYKELSKYRKPTMFFYNMDIDRLT